MAEPVTSESDDSVGTANGPKHARLFQSRSDDSFAAGLDDTRADEQMIGPEFRVAHAVGVAGEVLRLGEEQLSQFVVGRWEGAQGFDQ